MRNKKLNQLMMLLLFNALFNIAAYGEPQASNELSTATHTVESSLPKVLQLEERLIRAYESLQEKKSSEGDYMDRISAAYESLGEDAKTQLRDDSRKAKAGTDPGIQNLLRVIESTESELTEFQALYDEYNEAKFDYLIDRYTEFGTEAIKEAERSGTGEKRLSELEQSLEKMRKLRSAYYENKGNEGTNADRPRGQSFRRFLWEFDTLLRKSAQRLRSPSEFIRIGIDGILRPLKLVGKLIAAAPHLPNLYFKLRKGNGIVEALGKVVKAVNSVDGIQMNLAGAENIAKQTPPGQINVYAGMHPHSLFDLLSIAKMNIKKPLVLTALAPGIMKEGMENSDEFIIVKQSNKNPAALAAEKFRSGAAESLIIYPEGMMNLWGYETRPAQKNFVLLLKLLKKEGFKINLIPFSQPDNYHMGETQKAGVGPLDKTQLTTYIHKPMPPELVDVLLDLGDKQTLARVIRQQWIDSQSQARRKTSPDAAGMPTAKTWLSAFDDQKAQLSRCSVWLSKLGAN